MVYILNYEGKPLMPTSRFGKVRHMLKDGRAKVVKRTPFTIQLTYQTTEYVQPVTLGLNPGYEELAISCSTEKKELYAARQEIRTDITAKLEARRQARRTRRARLRYRKPRFNNRIRTKHKGWFAPSVMERVDCHVRACKKISGFLPIQEVKVQVASYDIQKIINPDISGNEYQQGLNGYNVREFVFSRDGYKCRCCKGKSKDPVLNVHHLKDLLKTDPKKHYSPANTITICETCHNKHHNEGMEIKFRAGGSFKAEAFANATKYLMVEKLRNEFAKVTITFGYLVKNMRIENNLPWSPLINALCIAGNPTAQRLDSYFHQKKIRCHNRQIYKQNPGKGGIYKKCQSPKYINGFKLWDKVLYNGVECFISGRNRRGYAALRTLLPFEIEEVVDGEIKKKMTTKVHSSAKMSDLKLLERASSILTEVRNVS